eukprot:365429-Chlamydomonas_euryale.AAC.11
MITQESVALKEYQSRSGKEDKARPTPPSPAPQTQPAITPCLQQLCLRLLAVGIDGDEGRWLPRSFTSLALLDRQPPLSPVVFSDEVTLHGAAPHALSRLSAPRSPEVIRRAGVEHRAAQREGKGGEMHALAATGLSLHRDFWSYVPRGSVLQL